MAGISLRYAAWVAIGLLALAGLVIAYFTGYFNVAGSTPARHAFLTQESDYYIADATAGHLHRPAASRIYDWPEYEGGKIVLATNNLGFRNAQDTAEQKHPGQQRIFILGDSHIDGVLPNNDNVAYHLQQRLNTRLPPPGAEVLNLGTGYHTFENYRGMVEKFAYLLPDAVVVIVYTGNDFLETIMQAVGNRQIANPERDAAYYSVLQQLLALERGPALIAQGFNQLYFFKHFPQLQSIALEFAQQSLAAINDHAAANQIALLVLLLPTKPDAESHYDAAALEQAVASVGFSAADLAINRRLTQTLAQWLTANGIAHRDLLEDFKNGADEYFWRRDYHINHKGHALIAKILDEHYHALLVASAD